MFNSESKYFKTNLCKIRVFLIIFQTHILLHLVLAQNNAPICIYLQVFGHKC